MVRKLIALSLSVFMILTSAVCMPLEAAAADVSFDTSSSRAVYPAYDKVPVTCVYSDDMFKGDSKPFNSSLATTSFIACCATYANAKNPDASKQADIIKAMLEDNGFTDFDANEDYREKASAETAPVGCAHKKIVDGGRVYTLLAILPRSGTYGEEFGKSMEQSKSASDKGDHAAYMMRSLKVADFVQDYVKKTGLKGDFKVWVTGYSGAGGVADLVAADLIRNPEKMLGSDAGLSAGNLYAYVFTGMNVAAAEGDHASLEDYEVIHNVYEPGEFLSNIPPQESFVRYGTDYYITEIGDRDRFLKYISYLNLDKYYEKNDPADFVPYKLDTEAIMKGELKLIPDKDSYLPDNQADYIDSVIGTMAELTARYSSSGNAREGYYKHFQQPIRHYVNYISRNGTAKMMGNVTGLLSETDTSIPMIISMYMTVLVEKSKANTSETVNTSFENAFNYMASQMENSDGSIKSGYRLSRKSYELFKKTFFVSDESGDRLYRLKNGINLKNTSLLLSVLRELRKKLYIASLRQLMEKNGADESDIKILTGDDDSSAMSEFFGAVLFENVLQDKTIEPFSFDNQQFKQLATLYGNSNRFMTLHQYFNVIEWLRSGDPNFEDYDLPNAANSTGYRRVYINTVKGAALSGNVKDAGGKIVARFRNGMIFDRTSDWIGITNSDSGCWLRLPLDETYCVNIDTGSSVKADLRIEEVAPMMESPVVRTVSSDSRYNWKGIVLAKDESVSLRLPAVKSADGAYSLPSEVSYRLNKSKLPLPAVKKVKVKAGRRSIKVNWAKLSKKSQKLISRIEVQYSTDKKFIKSASASALLEKTAGSIKINGLRKNQRYYVRVRTVRYKSGKKSVSGWSSVKKVKLG